MVTKPATKDGVKLLYLALQKDGRTVRDVITSGECPINFVETAFALCVEGYEEPGKVYELGHLAMQETAWQVFNNEILRPVADKKK